MYGAQTLIGRLTAEVEFENDVEMYGAQTKHACFTKVYLFENDVEMYGAQTYLVNAE